ncbi:MULTISPECIES: MarR family winged helix-turn-helix transcriptional regulator [unclassified Frankia]|uniref:MarR family winged helix-turn-helix transcriptional regulator n=1 Tax=unclassified Frankia TaxID=2632575 RepID=UPI001EF57CBF|nr:MULTISPECIES: MarR family transcriptional regulator [unclassified Frankia]
MTVDERTAEQESPIDPRSLRAWRQFLRAHSYVIRQLETDLESEHHLPLASFDVLVQLSEVPDGALRMNELAEAVLLSRSGLTRLVDRLERDGLVERRSCPSDARGTFATLTPEGRKRLRAASQTHLAGVSKHVTSHFNPDELDVLADLLSRLDPRAATPPPGGGCGQGA